MTLVRPGVSKIPILGSNSVFNISSKNTHNCKFKMAVNDPKRALKAALNYSDKVKSVDLVVLSAN
jgi:hypothetical protein